MSRLELRLRLSRRVLGGLMSLTDRRYRVGAAARRAPSAAPVAAE